MRINRLTILAVVVVLLSVTLHAAPPDGLVVYDALLARSKPPSTDLGMTSLHVVYSGELWDAGQDRTPVPTQAKINAAVADDPPGSLVCIDIEHWPINRVDDATIRANLPKYIETVRRFRRSRPDLKFGYYAVLPAAEYWPAIRPDGDTLKIAWYRRNLLYWPLAHEVDVVFPSLYTFYGDPGNVAAWPRYAEENISQARAYGKPVYPFIWPHHHPSDPKWAGKPIPPNDWLMQLRTLEPISDGVVLWDKHDPAWDWHAPWWRVTSQWLGLSGWE